MKRVRFQLQNDVVVEAPPRSAAGPQDASRAAKTVEEEEDEEIYKMFSDTHIGSKSTADENT